MSAPTRMPAWRPIWTRSRWSGRRSARSSSDSSCCASWVAGAFAHVYLARQPALGNRLVVVKVAQYGSGEAETLGRLAHRNIVPVYSVVEDPATHMTAVCMPYLGSATLLDVLDVGFADNRPPERARFIQDIALQAAIPQAVPDMYAGPDACLQHGTYVDGIVHLAIQTGGGVAAHAPGRHLPPRLEALQCAAHSVRMPDAAGLQSVERHPAGTNVRRRNASLHVARTAAEHDAATTRCRMPTAIRAPICFRWASSCMNAHRPPAVWRSSAGRCTGRSGGTAAGAAAGRLPLRAPRQSARQRPPGTHRAPVPGAASRSAPRVGTSAGRCAAPATRSDGQARRWARRRRFLIGAGVVGCRIARWHCGGPHRGTATATMCANTRPASARFTLAIGPQPSTTSRAPTLPGPTHISRCSRAGRPSWRRATMGKPSADLKAACDHVPARLHRRLARLRLRSRRTRLLNAEVTYATALNEYGYESVAIWNNRGWHALQSRQTRRCHRVI